MAALNRYLGERVRQMLEVKPTCTDEVLARIAGTLPKDAFIPTAMVGI